MNHNFQFTWESIQRHYENILKAGYKIITCAEYIEYKKSSSTYNIVVNRVDIDLSVKKAERLLHIFNKLNIKASFFLRLHANEYNPFSFENYRIIKQIISSGHELAYHSEIVDQATIWDESPVDCLKRDIEVMSQMFSVKVKGIASHGGLTGLNNLDFWDNNKASDFGLLYEVYDKQKEFNLFHECFYISDSEWTRWKCYDNGKLVNGDFRNPTEHLIDNHKIIQLLIHPDTFFDNHIYE